MRVVHLAAGAGGMYCGSCLHSNALAAALRAQGIDITLVPVYTPLRTDEPGEAVRRVAMGGINVYLQQISALFSYLPGWLGRTLDNPRLLRWAGRHSMAVRPAHLGPMTISVLHGEEGRQRKELDKLVDWLAEDLRPQVVHLSNLLLAGLARPIARRLRVPVVCTLSGEDIFLEDLPPRYQAEAQAILRDRCQDLAGLVALNRYYADRMAEYLAVDRQQIRVIRPGLSPLSRGAIGPGGGKELAEPAQRKLPSPACGRGAGGEGTPPQSPLAPASLSPAETGLTIGFLARICPAKGLHLLAEAFATLCDTPGLPPLRLHAAGYLDGADRPYLASVARQLAQRGLADRFQYLGQPDRVAKAAFLQSLDVMCLPTVYHESKGFPVLEAWAHGVPVVVPAHGTFPELLEDTGGGLLCRPGDAADLAARLQQLILDPALRAQCGRRARQAIGERYQAQRMACETIELYQGLLGNP
jgi:glycosyltransferase involved in cell wall biosynthesis